MDNIKEGYLFIKVLDGYFVCFMVVIFFLVVIFFWCKVLYFLVGILMGVVFILLINYLFVINWIDFVKENLFIIFGSNEWEVFGM